MFKNLALKAKVFLFISIVFVSLSFVYYKLFADLLGKINTQITPEKSFSFVEEKLKNFQFKLIANSMGITSGINFDKKGVVTFDAKNIKTSFPFAIINEKGAVVGGDSNLLNNFSGVPAADRALKSGIASDGFISINKKLYFIGAMPLKSDTAHAVLSIAPVDAIFAESKINLPVKIYYNNELAFESEKSEWEKISSSKYGKDVAGVISNPDSLAGAELSIDRWNKIMKFSLGVTNGEFKHSLTALAVVSYLPGHETYNKSLFYIGIFAAVAIFISLLFAFILTYEVDKVFRNIAADLSTMKVGEKLMLHKYSHGASTVISAINHLISRYQKHGETNPGIMIGSLLKGDSEEDEPVREKQAKKPISTFKKPATPSIPVQPLASASIQDEEADEPHEKTQIAEISSLINDINRAPEATPYEELWSEYRKIKVENGDSFAQNEKESFLAKLKANKAAILSKYNCRDVSFSIEEKDGKPVIKAKPLK